MSFIATILAPFTTLHNICSATALVKSISTCNITLDKFLPIITFVMGIAITVPILGYMAYVLEQWLRGNNLRAVDQPRTKVFIFNSSEYTWSMESTYEDLFLDSIAGEDDDSVYVSDQEVMERPTADFDDDWSF